MKQRILALVALTVSLGVFGVSVIALGHSMQNDLSNKNPYIIQLVGVSFIVLICAVNYILALQGKKEDTSDNNEESKPEE